MKTSFLVLFYFLASHCIRAQYGIEGAIYAAFDVGITWEEMGHLKDIADTQDKIVIYSAIIAAESLAIVAIDERILNSQTELKPAVEELKSIIHISRTAEKLIDYQTNIMNIVQETPLLIGLATKSQFKILSDAGYIMADLYIYTKEDKSNLMSNKNRIDIINATQVGLDELTNRSLKLYQFLDMARKTNFDVQVDALDISGIMEEMDQQIITIIND